VGRQINFYMSENVQQQFISFLHDNGFVFLNNYSKEVNISEMKDVYSLFLYKCDYGGIIMKCDNSGIMDIIKSPVIELNKTIVKDNEKKIIQGRLWLSHQYYDNNGNIIRKGKEIVKEYEKLVRWIKKNVPYQEIKKGKYLIKEYASDEIIDLQNQGYEYSI